MPLHAITTVHGEGGLRQRLLIQTRRFPSAERPRIGAALALMSRLHERDRRQREPFACHPLRILQVHPCGFCSSISEGLRPQKSRPSSIGA